MRSAGGRKSPHHMLVNICTEFQVGDSQISSEELTWESHMGNFISFLVIKIPFILSANIYWAPTLYPELT